MNNDPRAAVVNRTACPAFRWGGMITTPAVSGNPFRLHPWQMRAGMSRRPASREQGDVAAPSEVAGEVTPGRTSVTARAMSILAAFDAGSPRLTLAQITSRAGLAHATAYRLTQELVEWGALARQDDGTYCIGLRLWEIGTLAPQSVPLRELAMPVMEDLFVAINQHIQLAVRQGTDALVIERISAPKAIRLMSGVGRRLPLHASAAGQILLAHAEPELLEELIARPLRSYTPATVTDPVELRAALASCRSSGIAVVRGGLTRGAQSVATRITDSHNKVVAALSVVVRQDSAEARAVIPAAVTAGLNISRRIRDVERLSGFRVSG